ncbi:MAG: hypothetical protein ACYCOO_02045 [Chitinophagaceae bacterium]
MKAASLSELKKELHLLAEEELLEICLRLIRFKKENKELLTYLLFEANDEQGYVEKVKMEIQEEFAPISTQHWFWAKKSLRKILRSITRYTRYTGSKEAEVQWRLHFCWQWNRAKFNFGRNPAASKLYQQQINKLKDLIAQLHEDLQFEYLQQLESLV